MKEFGNSEADLLKKLGKNVEQEEDIDLVQSKLFTLCEEIT